MKKTFCDACRQEASCHVFDVPCHIAEPNRSGYIDRDGNQVSGRIVSFDLCNACSNKVYEAALNEIKRSWWLDTKQMEYK